MASEGSAVATTAPPADLPARGGRGGGRGRGRGQGRGRGRGDGFQNDNPNFNNGQAYHRGRGAGPRGPQNPAPGARPQPPAANLPVVQGNGAVRAKESMAGKTMAEGADESEAEVCFICASPVMHEAIYPCNHRTCHICALRMRALYKDKNCAHCRTEGAFVIFTDNAEKRYEDFADGDIVSVDQNIGIKYESNDIQDDTRLLLRYNCPDEDCDVACLGWPNLHRHVRSIHHKKICDLCSRHKKVFTHEHELYTDSELSRHMRKGDDNPGAVDQSGFKGHPICSFCNERFYGDDELFVHCREKHERCQLCDSLHDGRPPQYFVNYDALYSHFKADHFVCSHPSCLEKKFIAFTSEMDLKAHQLSEHGNDLSKDVRRDARIVDMSSFEYRQPYVQEWRGGGTQRENRGRGRGRDPNAEAIPGSTAQPLSRAEQAFHRQMEIQTSQNAHARTFGGQLTAPTPAPTPAQARPSQAAASRPTRAVEAATQAMGNMDVVEMSPQDRARRIRHESVIERATKLLQNDANKLQQFRNSISSFQNNALTGPALIESFFALFLDTSSSSLGTLVREVADLFEDNKKKEALLAAWNDWRAINEDYPSLPAAIGSSSGSIPLNWAVSNASGSGSGSSGNGQKSTRVLKLKSSTAQSSRSSVSQARSWGGSSTASSPSVATSSAMNAFPSLPPASRQNASSTKVSTVPWVATPAASSSNPGSARPTPPSSRPASRAVARDNFPALPPAAKPQSTIFGYGNGRMVRRDMGNSPVTGANPWGPPSASTGSSSEVVAEGDGNGGKGKKKGNKGKKQVLMGWG